MSLKIHFLHSHLEFFEEKCGAMSDENGQSFYQDISSIGKRYQGKWNCAILADYCCTFTKNVPTMKHKREAKRKKKTLLICMCCIINLQEKDCADVLYFVNIIPSHKSVLTHSVPLNSI